MLNRIRIILGLLFISIIPLKGDVLIYSEAAVPFKVLTEEAQYPSGLMCELRTIAQNLSVTVSVSGKQITKRIDNPHFEVAVYALVLEQGSYVLRYRGQKSSWEEARVYLSYLKEAYRAPNENELLADQEMLKRAYFALNDDASRIVMANYELAAVDWSVSDIRAFILESSNAFVQCELAMILYPYCTHKADYALLFPLFTNNYHITKLKNYIYDKSSY